MERCKVAPSILSADFSHLEEEINKIESLGAEYLHFDVMDGHFVDNISFGLPVLKSIAHIHHMINDVHIMITDPLKYGPRFAKAGADIVTFHLEALNGEKDVLATINAIKEAGSKVGISIKPNTPVTALDKYLPLVDLVLVMSVEPGFGGQTFIDYALDKIAYLKKQKEKGYKYLIEVDGGINKETAKLCREAGVDILVAGSYIFHSDDYKKAIDSLRG